MRSLRDRLYQGLLAAVPGVTLNGPALDRPEWRLPGNLNLSFAGVEGESLLLNAANVALAPAALLVGEARAKPRAAGPGVGDRRTRSSVRFGLGRFNTDAEVEAVIVTLAKASGGCAG